MTEDDEIVEAMARSLGNILAHFGKQRDQPPGHSHRVPGIWDKDIGNGAKGATVCEWCAAWNEAATAYRAYRERMVVL